jgi:hypothetical protein
MRLPLAPQIKALCEKIDAYEFDDTSFKFVLNVEDLCLHLGPWERFCVKRAIAKNKRSRVLNRAMELVIGKKEYDANTMRFETSGRYNLAQQIRPKV